MSAFSDYIENAVINALFRNTAFPSPPANVYIALFTVAPTDSGGGTEVSGGSYARTAVSTTGGWAATSGTDGLTSNIADITFPTASGSWGTVVAMAIFDASSGGNMYFYGNLAVSKAVGNGDVFKFLAGNLTITVA